ncbi:uncharacterized protein THITE_2117993 [Thermothielavioides terrestris NRRL 8126]|uniref:FAD-binding domain-containing protein n=2 Tax=Thermothielavioides terrestris TaxID=2587410 RepID=G2R6B5_THETT|nr:uncharacterized protein THITE_2117993 [Thermothielavioides terrestris NRRL 8126]AEO68448.1 hypothetical protein THITE_2117993 [Thermothielavioides terrestris NRRL 8126]
MPRGAGYQGGTLAALDRAGVLKKAVALGHVSRGLCWRKPPVDDGAGGMRYGDIIARVAFPPSNPKDLAGTTSALVLPQSKLAKLFLDEVQATGLVKVHFGMELTAIDDDGDSVKATFRRTGDGTQETHEAAFLVGADGGRSTTRKLLNIQFLGHSWPERIVAIDCVFEVPRTTEREYPVSFIVHPIHFGVVLPLDPYEPGERSLCRCAVGLDPADTRSDEEVASKESLRDLLEKMLPGPRPLDVEIIRAAPHRIHQLCASTFRRGRCILAGDAAHLNNPFGGLGLNSGLLDAEAAADALALILNEGKPLDLLDAYAAERQRVFQIFTNPVSTMNKLRCARDPEHAHEDWVIRLVNADPAALKVYGKHFYSTWRTDMRALAAKLSSSA